MFSVCVNIRDAMEKIISMRGALILLLALIAVSSASWAEDGSRLKLATTTSLYDTKLLDTMDQKFWDECGVRVDPVSGGTGIAIQYGERGDVDLIIIHDKARELKFVKDGQGLQRRCFAYNYFYIVSPKDDPAGAAGLNATQAFAKIREEGLKNPDKVKFVSRGDKSGTHTKEQSLWKGAGFNYSSINNSSNRWYLEAGTGMGATLVMANEKSAYTLTDMSTFMAYKGNLSLVPLIQGGTDILNVYVAIAVNPDKHPGVSYTLANKFINFLVSDEGQALIANFGREKYGQPLFFAARGNCTKIGCSGGECAVLTNVSCSDANSATAA